MDEKFEHDPRRGFLMAWLRPAGPLLFIENVALGTLVWLYKFVDFFGTDLVNPSLISKLTTEMWINFQAHLAFKCLRKNKMWFSQFNLSRSSNMFRSTLYFHSSFVLKLQNSKRMLHNCCFKVTRRLKLKNTPALSNTSGPTAAWRGCWSRKPSKRWSNLWT